MPRQIIDLWAVPSFMNVEKDLGIILERIAQCQDLLKLLILKEKSTNPLTDDEKAKALSNVRIVPSIENLNTSSDSYIVVVFDNFMPNGTNSEHLNKTLHFNIICNMDTWDMGDCKLRPYKIAGYLNMLFDRKSLDGTYNINFMNASNLIIDQEIAGLMLNYDVIYSRGSDTYDE